MIRFAIKFLTGKTVQSNKNIWWVKVLVDKVSITTVESNKVAVARVEIAGRYSDLKAAFDSKRIASAIPNFLKSF